MPTPADLRRALDQLEAEAPDPARTRTAVLGRLGPTYGRRRWSYRTGPLLVAAVAVLVALASVMVLSVRSGAELGEPVGSPTPSPLGSPPPPTELVWTFDVPEPPAGTVLLRLSISADKQTGALERTGTNANVLIGVHAPGAFDPTTEMRQPQRVEVEGRQGYFGPVGDGEYESLVWPTPEGGWVQLDGFGLVPTPGPDIALKPAELLAEQLSYASLLRFGRFGSPRLPFRLGWFPSGLSVQAVGSVVATRDGTFGSALFRDDDPGTSRFGTITVARQDAVTGSFNQEIEAHIGSDRTALTIGGRPAVLGPASLPEARGRYVSEARVLAVDLGDGSAFLIYVANTAVDRYPLDVMRRIAEEADVTMAIADPSTWIPAPEAVAG